jgi:hypothetical protein
MRSASVILLISTIAIWGCQQEQTIESKFHGLWSLYAMEQQDAETGEWNDWRNGMQGYILYANDGYMSVHLTTKGYQDTALRFPNFTDTISTEALKYLTKSYTYVAKYTVFEQESVVRHARISHSNPGEWNDVVRRRYTFSGDTLILAPEEEQNSSLRLKWVKSN